MHALRIPSTALAFALLTVSTLTACGQAPASAPAVQPAAAQEAEASSLFKSPEEKAIATFLKKVVGEPTMRITKLEVSGGVQHAFRAQVQVQNAESRKIPARGLKTWIGSVMKYPDASQKTNRFVVSGQDISTPSNYSPKITIIVAQ